MDTWECEQVTRVPAHIRSGYRLSTFYQKYLHAYGIPIISSNRTQDNALRRACYVVVFLLADRLDIRTWFYRRRGRAGVIAHSENATSIPEHSWGPNKWNQQTRGMGATREHPISTGRYMLHIWPVILSQRIWQTIRHELCLLVCMFVSSGGGGGDCRKIAGNFARNVTFILGIKCRF